MLDVFWLEFLRRNFALKQKRNRLNYLFFFEKRSDLFDNRIADNNCRRRKIKGWIGRSRRRVWAVQSATQLRGFNFRRCIFTLCLVATLHHLAVFRMQRHSRQHTVSKGKNQKQWWKPLNHLSKTNLLNNTNKCQDYSQTLPILPSLVLNVFRHRRNFYIYDKGFGE